MGYRHEVVSDSVQMEILEKRGCVRFSVFSWEDEAGVLSVIDLHGRLRRLWIPPFLAYPITIGGQNLP